MRFGAKLVYASFEKKQNMGEVTKLPHRYQELPCLAVALGRHAINFSFACGRILSQAVDPKSEKLP